MHHMNYVELVSKVSVHFCYHVYYTPRFNRCFSVHFDKYKNYFANKCTVY